MEFLVLSLFLKYIYLLDVFIYFYFLSFTVISSVIGILIIVGIVKFYGLDLSLFYRFKLIYKLLVFKTKNLFCRGFIIILVYLFFKKMVKIL